MKVAEPVNNAIIVTIEDGRQHFHVIDEKGRMVDEFEIPSSHR